MPLKAQTLALLTVLGLDQVKEITLPLSIVCSTNCHVRIYGATVVAIAQIGVQRADEVLGIMSGIRALV